jgi:hypothetical protein
MPNENKQCTPTSHWVICDDGFVVWGNGIVGPNTKVSLCKEHGGSDPRRINVDSFTGRDWKVVVTPIDIDTVQ